MAKKKSGAVTTEAPPMCLSPGPGGTQCDGKLGHEGGHTWKRLRPAKSPPAWPRWVEFCPVCLQPGDVVGVVPMCVDGSRRRYQWMCRACVEKYHAIGSR